MLFSYKAAYKVATGYTPYQLAYRLHPLMPTEYIVPVVGGNEKDNTLMKVLTNRITELEKLQEARIVPRLVKYVFSSIICVFSAYEILFVISKIILSSLGSKFRFKSIKRSLVVHGLVPISSKMPKCKVSSFG
jgi:hypothetical protein